MNRRFPPRGGPRARKPRRGSATLDMVVTLSVTFALVMAGYQLAVVACRNLYHLIASFVGSPYM